MIDHSSSSERGSELVQGHRPDSSSRLRSKIIGAMCMMGAYVMPNLYDAAVDNYVKPSVMNRSGANELIKQTNSRVVAMLNDLGLHILNQYSRESFTEPTTRQVTCVRRGIAELQISSQLLMDSFREIDVVSATIRSYLNADDNDITKTFLADYATTLLVHMPHYTRAINRDCGVIPAQAL